MSHSAYEIRKCESCGLRYPLVEGHPFGTRCPACMGTTRVLLSRRLISEPDSALPSDTPPKHDKKSSIKTIDRKLVSGEGRGGGLAVLLDNIRSAGNVGSILRSADGFAFTHAYLCGITPTADNEAVTKTSLGAEDSVPWSYHKDAVRLVTALKAEGWKVFALEDDNRAITMNGASSAWSLQRDAARHAALIVGNEVTGVDPELLDLCDTIFSIPMRGEKKSFNVAIAFGIAAYALTVHMLER